MDAHDHRGAGRGTVEAHRRAGEPRRSALSLLGLGGVAAGGSARDGAARVRHAAGGGVRAGEAARDGLRDDHRPRHDRWGAGDRRSARRVRLGGADRPLPRRAPGGARALLRDHARGSRVAAAPQPRRGGVRRVHARARDRVRAGASLLHRRRPAVAPPPPPPGGAVRDLGGAQRRSRARAQPPGGDLHRHARRDRDRRQRRPRGGGHRPDVHRDAARRTRPPSCWPICAPGGRARAASRAAPPSGRTPRSRSPPARWEPTGMRPRQSRARPRTPAW